ncbi:MAG: hypothetical protein LBP42_01490 [Treponema sp.]|jgi:hypothetical protein|nr:hypothetical protein [Treponema sp.]
MENRTVRRGILLGFLFLGVLAVYGMDWPSQEGVMIHNFGSNDGGKPMAGVSFEAEGPIRAADTGELVFIHSPSNTASRLPAPLGAWIALGHRDGLVSIYGRFEDQGNTSLPNLIEKNTMIAQAGLSGWTGKGGFYFSLFDRRERRWVNPSMIISPPEDTRAPLIQSVMLKNAGGRIINPAQVRTIGQGRYTILVEVTDTLREANDPPLAPHRILCSVNGIEIGVLTFETLSVRDGTLMVYRNSLVPARQVYAPFPAFEAGEVSFTRGQAALEIIAQDISGNSRNVVYRLQVE